MGTENKEESCSQRDSAERKGYVRAHRSFNRIWKERDSAEPDILGKILDRDNLNAAYRRVKANKGAPGVDGMTIEEALPWLKEHKQELIERIRKGKYTPSPVRRVEIPKPDGGIRKLGIPTVTDRIIQQAIAQWFLIACLYLSIKMQELQGLRSSLFILATSVTLWNTLISDRNMLFFLKHGDFNLTFMDTTMCRSTTRQGTRITRNLFRQI